ncbi:hypothetical protein ASD99_31060 [Mesorhizobium sp. Root695]|uniref:replication protein RepA n=1 Tax=Mesorhizobium sp. Root695 TaxID=1736589 RepID=UPI0007094A2C|nr:replication protein RepA [Mesorhizobium sp. Root695]KRB18271.1 hypothetical protein ASD99_31060 [Mesorhizobium sp. Root695]
MTTYAIRDADLLAKLEEARGKFLFETTVRNLEHQQAERDADAVKAAARATHLATLSRDSRRRAIVREVIESEGPSPDLLRFLPTPLAICGLPYRRLPTGTPYFERQQGRMAVTVSPGYLRSPDGKLVAQPIPWGPKARLIMAHLSTEALKNRSPIVETANSLSAFMLDMGFEVRGGANGSIQPFKEQMRALAACRMEFSAWDGKKSSQIDVKPMERVELWFGDHPDQQSLWPTTIAFSERFFAELQKHALPIDVRALRAFSNSARKLDLLFWISYRITRLNERLVLDWKPLKAQFGEGFARDRDFRAQLADDLASIHEIFPKLPIKLTDRGLEMEAAEASVLAIPRRIRG